jgi:hypothetical protein
MVYNSANTEKKTFRESSNKNFLRQFQVINNLNQPNNTSIKEWFVHEETFVFFIA